MMVIGDSNPVRHIRFAAVNYCIILACILAFVVGIDPMVWGLYPAQLLGLDPPPAAPMPLKAALLVPDLSARLAARAGWERLLAHMMLHSDLLHLGGNMLVLWVFGNNIEDATGHWRYPLFFVLCGLAGGLLESVMTDHPFIPIVGASGAIAGVMGAYLLLHPRARLLVLLAFRVPVMLPASVVVGVFVASDLLGALLPDDDPTMLVAWWAHIGGFLAGMVLILAMRHADVPLFQPAEVYPLRPFGWLGRLIPDLGPRRRGEDPARSRWRDRAMFVFKTLAFLALLALLMAYFE